MKFLAVFLFALFCVALAQGAVHSAENSEMPQDTPVEFAIRSVEGPGDDDEWYKALNNLISVAAHNILVSGEFLALYPFSDLHRLPPNDYCNRQLNFDPTRPEKFKGIMKTVYQTGVIKIGVASIVSLPYFSNATGTPSGFFFDLGNSVANEMGFILKKTIRAHFVGYLTTDFFANATQALARGDVDAIVGMSYLVPRSTKTDYSCWYETPSPFAVYRHENKSLPAGFTLPTTLNGWNNGLIKVATLFGSIFETAARRYLPNCQFVDFPNMDAAFDSVGVSTDIVFSIIGETDGYNEAHGNRLAVQEGTVVNYGGGNAFATHRP